MANSGGKPSLLILGSLKVSFCLICYRIGNLSDFILNRLFCTNNSLPLFLAMKTGQRQSWNYQSDLPLKYGNVRHIGGLTVVIIAQPNYCHSFIFLIHMKKDFTRKQLREILDNLNAAILILKKSIFFDKCT